MFLEPETHDVEGLLILRFVQVLWVKAPVVNSRDQLRTASHHHLQPAMVHAEPVRCLPARAGFGVPQTTDTEQGCGAKLDPGLTGRDAIRSTKVLPYFMLVSASQRCIWGDPKALFDALPSTNESRGTLGNCAFNTSATRLYSLILRSTYAPNHTTTRSRTVPSCAHMFWLLGGSQGNWPRMLWC